MPPQVYYGRGAVSRTAGRFAAIKIEPEDEFEKTNVIATRDGVLVQDSVAAASKTSFKNHLFFTIAVKR